MAIGQSSGYSYSKSSSHASELPQIETFGPRVTASYLQQMPQILQMIQQQVPQLERSYWQAQKRFAPKYAQQNLGLLGKAAGAERGINEQAWQQAVGQEQAINPEFYRSRALTEQNLRDVMSPNLTGSELSNIERGLNRQFIGQGTFNAPGNVQQLEAALQYGGAGRQRQMEGLQLAQNLLPAMQSPLKAQYNPKQISEGAVLQKTSAQDTTKNLLYNPTEAALEAYRTALSIPDSSSKSRSFDQSSQV